LAGWGALRGRGGMLVSSESRLVGVRELARGV
jgi:hypothetical protein